MAHHELTFPITDPAEILKLRAGDEVTVQGHIIGNAELIGTYQKAKK